MDRDGAKVIIENIENLKAKGTAVLITSVAFKDTLILSEKAYRLNHDGLVELDNNIEESKDDREDIEDKKPVYKIEKIPAKVEERILLFDPTEVDYIESQQGISNLNIRGDKFPCTISLAD